MSFKWKWILTTHLQAMRTIKAENAATCASIVSYKRSKHFTFITVWSHITEDCKKDLFAALRDIREHDKDRTCCTYLAEDVSFFLSRVAPSTSLTHFIWLTASRIILCNTCLTCCQVGPWKTGVVRTIHHKLIWSFAHCDADLVLICRCILTLSFHAGCKHWSRWVLAGWVERSIYNALTILQKYIWAIVAYLAHTIPDCIQRLTQILPTQIWQVSICYATCMYLFANSIAATDFWCILYHHITNLVI